MSPIEWILVMLIVISSGVTIWTLIVNLERKVPDSYFLSDEKVKQLTLKTLGNLNPSRSVMSGKVYYSEGLVPTLVRGKEKDLRLLFLV